MMRKYFLHFIVVFSGAGLAWYLDAFNLTFFNYSGKYTPENILDYLVAKKSEVHAKECIPGTTTCFLVVDTYYKENESLTTKRELLLADNTDYSLTGVEVQSIKPLSRDNQNSRYWPVNKVVVNARYARMMIAAGFMMENLNFEDTIKKQVLVGGLGGGAMSNFLSELSYLNIHTTVVEKEAFMVEIAEKYFDHFETESLKIVTADLFDYVADIKNKFDTVLVDTCHNHVAEIICPVTQMLNENNVKKLHNALKSKGSIVVNIHIQNNGERHEAGILKLFSGVFESCFYMKYYNEEKVLICSKVENWTWKQHKKQMMQTIELIDDMFEFKLSKFIP